jgi:hypothetical protein
MIYWTGVSVSATNNRAGIPSPGQSMRLAILAVRLAEQDNQFISPAIEISYLMAGRDCA